MAGHESSLSWYAWKLTLRIAGRRCLHTACSKGFVKATLAGRKYFQLAKQAYDLMVDRFVVNNGTDNTLNREGTVKVGSLVGNGSYGVCIASQYAHVLLLTRSCRITSQYPLIKWTLRALDLSSLRAWKIRTCSWLSSDSKALP